MPYKKNYNPANTGSLQGPERGFRMAKKSAVKGEVRFQEVVREMLTLLGEDPKREGLERTPERVARSLQDLTQGYKQDVKAILKNAVFTEPYDEMVIVKDIEIFSLC